MRKAEPGSQQQQTQASSKQQHYGGEYHVPAKNVHKVNYI